MSRSMHIVCLLCKEHLWIGQNETLYTGEPHTMEALRQFFERHTTYYHKEFAPDEYHELLYMPEPYNGAFEEEEKTWKEIDADDYKNES